MPMLLIYLSREKAKNQKSHECLLQCLAAHTQKSESSFLTFFLVAILTSALLCSPLTNSSPTPQHQELLISDAVPLKLQATIVC